MNPKLSQIPYRLETERLVLRCLSPEDAPQILEAVDESRGELSRWLTGMVSIQTFADALAFARRSRGHFDLVQAFSFGIFERTDGRLLGGVLAKSTEPGGLRMGLEFWVRTSMTNRGIAHDALVAIVRKLLAVGVQRIDMLIEPNNRWSRAVAARLGFRKEGMLHGVLKQGDRSIDVVSYAMLGAWTVKETQPESVDSSTSGAFRVKLFAGPAEALQLVVVKRPGGA